MAYQGYKLDYYRSREYNTYIRINAENGQRRDQIVAVAYKDDVKSKLERETEATKNLLVHLRAMNADDEETVNDSVEGETSFLEAVTAVLLQIREEETHIAAIKEFSKSLKERAERKEQRKDGLRAALEIAFLTAFEGQEDKAKTPTPFGTMTLAKDAPKLGELDEPKIPSKYWITPDPVLVLDKKALLADAKLLSDDEEIPGAPLIKGGHHIVISKR